MNSIYIKSPSNQIVKNINSLRKKSSEGNVLVEGVRAVLDARKNGAVFTDIIIREGYMGELPPAERVYTFEPRLFDKTAATVTPQGIMALARTSFADLGEICGGTSVICDNIRDPGNMGTIIRTAHAAGALGVVVGTGCVDPFGEKAVRASMGSVFAVKIVRIKNINELLTLRENHVKIIAGDVGEGAVSLYEADLTGRAAVIVGNEAGGISAEFLGICDKRVKIPMPGGAESLNVSAACAVILYEHLRQNL